MYMHRDVYAHMYACIPTSSYSKSIISASPIYVYRKTCDDIKISNMTLTIDSSSLFKKAFLWKERIGLSKHTYIGIDVL